MFKDTFLSSLSKLIIMFTCFMSHAINEALIAKQFDEVPIGAIITFNNQIIATGHNLTKTNNDPTAHAEIIAIRYATQKIGNYRLNDCDLYVTLEPCTMCVGAIAQARIRRLYYGADDPKGGAVKSGINFFSQPTCHHKIEIYDGIKQKKCSELLHDFFSRL